MNKKPRSGKPLEKKSRAANEKQRNNGCAYFATRESSGGTNGILEKLDPPVHTGGHLFRGLTSPRDTTYHVSNSD